MSNRRLLVFLSAVLGIAVSCKQLEVKNLPYSIGGVDEMVVVLNAVDSTDTLFQAIDQYLGAIYNNTPQPEYRFGVTYIDVATYRSTFQKHRNLLFIGDLETPGDFSQFISELVGVETLKKVRSAGASFYLPLEDVWAKPQYVEAIVAADRTLLLAGIDTIMQGLTDRISQRELEKIRKNQFLPGHNNQVETVLREQHQIDMQVPSEFTMLKASNDNFIFLRKSTIDLTATIMIYYEPYTDSAQLNPTYLLHLRDSLGHQYESSRVPGSYMQTEYRAPSEHNVINLNGYYCLESRGLWRLINDFMGGPFINYWIVDEANNRLVYIDAYVYAPDMRKRPQIRQLESVISTYGLSSFGD
jgi:hypothetical protein